MIGNWTLMNKHQSNIKQSSNIFIKENAFEYVICKMSSILSQAKYIIINKSNQTMSSAKATVWIKAIEMYFKNADELFNLRAPKIFMLYKKHTFSVWVIYFVWNFKG